MKHRIKSIPGKKGMTMVNVLVAFALLLMILLMFSQAINLAMGLFVKSEQVRRHTESLYSAFYSETEYTSPDTDQVLTFTGKPGDTFTITTPELGEYEKGSDTIYYFGSRKSVSP